MKKRRENPLAAPGRPRGEGNVGKKRGDPLIARRVREARERAGISQEELADTIGRGRSTITGIETEHRPAGRATLMKLAEYFTVPVDYFTNRDELMAQAVWVLGRMPRDELEDWVSILTRRATSDRLPPRD